MSPCSVPDWLRLALPLETAPEQAACRQHDTLYELGGDRARRLRADLLFGLDLLAAGMDPDRAEQYVWGVRMYGHTHWPNEDGPGAPPLSPPVPVEAP